LPADTTAVGFNEVLHVEDSETQVIATYASEYYAGQPAMTRRAQGKGEVWYYGAAYSEPVVDVLIDELGLKSPVQDWLDVPAEVEIGIRASGDKVYVFLLNYSDQPVTIHLRQAAKEMITNQEIENTVEFSAFDVMILETPDIKSQSI